MLAYAHLCLQYLSSASLAEGIEHNEGCNSFAEMLEASEDVGLGEDELHNLLHYASACLHLDV